MNAEPRENDGTPAQGREEQRRDDARHLVTATAICGLLVAILLLAGAVTPEAALAGTAIGFVCLALIAMLALPPADLQRYLGRVKSITLGSLGMEFGEYERLAKAEGQGGEGDEDQEYDDGESLLDLRFQLEEKLAYLAKHVLAPDPGPESPNATYLNVGSLRHDKLLTKKHVRIAIDVLTMREYELRRLPEKERRTFLAGARGAIGKVRIEVFSAQVKQELEAAGWLTCPAFGPPSRRRDLLVHSNDAEDGVQHHVIPVFAVTRGSGLLPTPLERLSERAKAKCGGLRFIVVPPRSATPRPADTGGVKIGTLADLLEDLSTSKAQVETPR
jgi:hypothetical protein